MAWLDAKTLPAFPMFGFVMEIMIVVTTVMNQILAHQHQETVPWICINAVMEDVSLKHGFVMGMETVLIQWRMKILISVPLRLKKNVIQHISDAKMENAFLVDGGVTMKKIAKMDQMKKTAGMMSSEFVQWRRDHVTMGNACILVRI